MAGAGRETGQYIEPMRAYAALRNRLAGIGWPTLCAVCRQWDDTRVCRACIARFAAPGARCARCALRVPAGVQHCAACVQRPPPFERTIAAVDYAFPWDGLITGYKFRGALDLVDSLGRLLGQAVLRDAALPPDVLVPLPLSAARLAERGYNQAWLLARAAGDMLGIDATPHALRRLLDTPRQADLPLRARAANVRGSFGIAAAHRVQRRAVALVDDVMTSGATAAEAAQVLLAAGAASVQVWVLARTPAPSDQ